MIRIQMVTAAFAVALVPALAPAQTSDTPMGAERPTTGTPTSKSSMTREQRKAATKEAQRKGELTPAGGGHPVYKSASSQKSTMTREQRKAETMEARKKGELVPPGGGSPAPSK